MSPRVTTSRSSEPTEHPLASASETAARVFGIVFILIGLILIVSLVGGFIISKLPYRVDPNLPIPTLDETDTYTNKDTLDITGTVLPGEEVVLYMDEERIDGTVETNEDGSFSFEGIALPEEGERLFEAAVIRGGLFKRRSEKSNVVSSIVDWTSPSTLITLNYEKDNTTGRATITGTAEPFAIITLKGDTKDYEATADSNGDFIFSDVILAKGANSFSIRVKDRAGNEVVATKKVEIAYEGGSVNGDGASIIVDENGNELPESAGELGRALEILAGNKVMLALAGTSFLAFGLSSFLVRRKMKDGLVG